MNRKIFYILIIILCSCASEKALTGGDKDSVEPQIKNIYPKNKAVNFTSNLIEIEFDERIKIEDFEKNLIISPQIDVKIKATAKNKKLKLFIDGAFNTNTTYTLNIRNSISDITENNKIESLYYIFSTGNYIDSCYLVGTTEINNTKIKQENAKILIYSESDSIDIRKQKPNYYTITNSNGEYKIENLPKGNYYLYCLNDKNNNLLFDDEKEEIGFLTNSIILDSNIIVEKINVFLNDTIINKPTINEYCNNNTLSFDEEIFQYNLNNIDLPSLVSKDRKNITFYNTYSDSFNLILNVKDYNLNERLDTFNIKRSIDSICNRAMTITLETSEINKEDSIIFTYKEPIKEIKKELINFYSDSILIGNLSNFNYYIIDNQIVIKNNEEFKEHIKIIFDSTSITTYNEKMVFNKSEYIIPYYDETKVGKLAGKLNYNKNNFVIELLDHNYNVVRNTNNKEFIFDKLKPQDYFIRVKIDDNNDGIYQTGNYDKRVQPEKIVFHKEKINLRPNWEIEGIIIDIYQE